MSCLFCHSQVELSDEHVFPAAFGGRAALKDGTCKACNNKFNKEFEEDTVQSLVPIRNMLLIPDRRGKIPKIDAHVSVEGQIHRGKILKGGILSIPPMKFELTTVNGGTEVIYRAFSEKDSESLLANLEAKGIRIESAPPETPSSVESEFEWKAGFLVSEAAFRTVAKIALIGFAFHYGVKSLESKAFDFIKTFVQTGTADEPPVKLFSNEQFLNSTYFAPQQHMILFAADKKKKRFSVIIGLFGGITYFVTLSELWEGPDLLKTYGVNGQNGEDCFVLPTSLENELNAITLVLSDKTKWNDVKASGNAFLARLLR